MTASSDVLLTAEDLLAADPAPVVLDVRWTLAGPDQAAYAAGHVPGARFCDLDAHLAAAAGSGGRHPLPEADALIATLAGWGITPDSSVVVYDDCNSLAASRAWWCLRWVGVTNTRILDGGLAAWQRAGGTLSTDPATDFPAAQPWSAASAQTTVTADDLANIAADDDLCVVDVRTAERYRGEAEPIDPVAGHIPGAVNLPIGELLTAAGMFKSPDELAVTLKNVTDGATRVAGYCGSGVTASQLVAAGAIAGVPIALYPGSWSHWITDPNRPIATS